MAITINGQNNSVNNSSGGNVTINDYVADNIGNLRSLGVNSRSSSYTLTSTDVGKVIITTTGGIIVPSGIFSAGQTIVICNNSGSSQTITQGSGITMYLGGIGATGDRTLSLYGIATVLCVTSNTFVITGTGLT